MALYRDATASGDRVMAENYLQHADHYYRIICAANAEAEARRNPPQPNGNAGDTAQVTEARPQQGDGSGQRAAAESNGRDARNGPEESVDPGSAPQPEIVVPEEEGAAEEAAPAAEAGGRSGGPRRNGHGGRGGQRRGRSAQQKTEQPKSQQAPAAESTEPASPAPVAAPADAEPSA